MTKVSTDFIMKDAKKLFRFFKVFVMFFVVLLIGERRTLRRGRG